MADRRPWEGEQTCSHRLCRSYEIEGLGACLIHVADEDLAEAEAITGMKRCRQCLLEVATAASDPPRCPRCISAGLSSKRASPGYVEQAMEQRLAAVMTEHGDRLLNPPPIGEPLDALLKLAAELAAFTGILTEKVASLKMEDWRYRHDRVGEQIRTELFLYERALERQGKLLIAIAKLRIRDHKASMDAETVKFCLQAFGIALEASGAGLDGQHKAREVLGRELQKIVT